MSSPSDIQYLTHTDIDKKKWDDCIHKAVNGLIYGYSFYLDNMAMHWDALVLSTGLHSENDYEAVMPLTWKKKWGIKYLYQPAFTQQGGIFFKTKLPAEFIKTFTAKTCDDFKFAEIAFNFSNDLSLFKNDLQIVYRNNYILNLQKPYAGLYDDYLPNFKKSLRRIKKFDLNYTITDDFSIAINLYRQLYERFSFFSASDLLNFENICRLLSKENKVIARYVYDTENKLLAAVLLLKDEKRLYNMISCITAEGKKREANYFLYDNLISEFAGNSLLFDFEGSDLAGVSDFYKKFNPENQVYPFIKFNTLHPIFKLFKQ
ncbi:MAG: hypothetical protein M3O67_02735 [Bacteroidota bacterium]|nr:hypothetical protein [Bacteroidota bacterium]